MAKTLLQYFCLYILPFLFGMCLCGLRDEEFLTVGKTEQGRSVGRGRIVCGGLQKFGEMDLEINDVILEPIEGLRSWFWPCVQRDTVSVYMKKDITGMDNDAVGVVLKEAANDLDNWIDMQIHGDHSKVGGNIHWTISPLPGATTYPNIEFSAPAGNLLGYRVYGSFRFLGIDPETIKLLHDSIVDCPDDLIMSLIYENSEKIFSKVTVNPDSLKVSGGGYILDLTLS